MTLYDDAGPFSLANSNALSRIRALISSKSSASQLFGNCTRSPIAATSASVKVSFNLASMNIPCSSIAVYKDLSAVLLAVQTVDWTSVISAGSAPFFFLKFGTVILSFRLKASSAGTTTPPIKVISMKNHFRPIYEAGLNSDSPCRPFPMSPIFVIKSSKAGLAVARICYASSLPG